MPAAHFPPMLRATSLAFGLLALTAPAASAQCATAGTGAKCAVAGQGLSGGGAGKWLRAPERPPAARVGDRLVPGEHFRLINTRRYGLPPAGDDWVYYKLDRDIFRVDRDTLEVLEDVTDRARFR